MKKRLDILLVEKGLAESREKAKTIIMSGIVYVDGEKEDKAGSTFPEEADIEVRGKTLRYVRISEQVDSRDTPRVRFDRRFLYEYRAHIPYRRRGRSGGRPDADRLG